jgi:hypothetical protein
MAIKRWKLRSKAKGKIAAAFATAYLDDFAPEPSDWISDRYDGNQTLNQLRTSLPPVYPHHRMTILERNPVFSFPTFTDNNASASEDANVWTVEVRLKGGAVVATYTSDPGFNHVPATSTLPLGRLEWRVTDPLAGGGGTSAWREFHVAANAVVVNAPTRLGTEAVIAAKARPRFLPADMSYYNTVRLRARQLMEARYATFGVGSTLPAATGLSVNAILTEIQYMADLQHLWKITGNAIYRVEAVRRIEGNGSTTGIAYWEPTPTAGNNTWGNDDLYRYSLEAMSAAYDSFADHLTAGGRLAFYTNIAQRLKHGDTPIVSAGWIQADGPAGYTRWIGRRWLFGGHIHNLWRTMSMAAAAIQGDHVLFPGIHNAQAMCTKWCTWAYMVVRRGSDMRTDAGGYKEFRGYQESEYDFEFASNCLGEAMGVRAAALPFNREPARLSALLYPFNTAYGMGGDGHDTSNIWTGKFTNGLRRAGGMIETGYITVGSIVTEAFLSSQKGDDYHHLSAQADPTLGNITAYPRGAYSDTIAAIHSDRMNINRVSYYFPMTPYGQWNHAHLSPGARYITFRQQQMTRRRSVYDYNNSPHQHLEGGWPAGGSFVIGMGTDFSAAGVASQTDSRNGRAARSYAQQVLDDPDRKVFVLTRELTPAVSTCITIPVKSNPAGTGYLLHPSAKKLTSVEQTVTVTHTAGGISMSGSVSGSLATVGSTSDNPQVFIESYIAGTNVVGDTYTFDIVKVNRAQAFDVMLGEDILLMGNHYEFASARPSALMFGSMDVASTTITVDATGLATGTTVLPRLTAGLPVPIEVSGASTAGVNGVYLANATTPYNFTFQTAAAAGAVAGATFVNLGVQTSGNELFLRNNMNTVGLPGFARVVMLKPAASLSLNFPGWRHPDTQLNFAFMNASVTEQGSGLLYQSPRLHVWRNRIEYAPASQLSGFLALVSPGEKPAPTVVSNTVTGAGAGTISTIVVTVEGKTYTVTHTAATNTVTVA